MTRFQRARLGRPTRTGHRGAGSAAESIPALQTAVLLNTAPVSYWPLYGEEAQALADLGSAGATLTKVGTGAIAFNTTLGPDGESYPISTANAPELHAANVGNRYDYYADSEGNVDISFGAMVNIDGGGGNLMGVCVIADTTPRQWYIDVTKNGANATITTRQCRTGGSVFGQVWDTTIPWSGAWLWICGRIFGEFNYPSMRCNGATNDAGSGAGGLPSHNTSAPLRIFGNRDATPFKGTVGHVWFKNTYVYDGAMDAMDAAAVADGWY